VTITGITSSFELWRSLSAGLDIRENRVTVKLTARLDV